MVDRVRCAACSMSLPKATAQSDGGEYYHKSCLEDEGADCRDEDGFDVAQRTLTGDRPEGQSTLDGGIRKESGNVQDRGLLTVRQYRRLLDLMLVLFAAALLSASGWAVVTMFGEVF